MSCVSKCTRNDPGLKCKGWMDRLGQVHNGCDDPCRFVMQKSGEGDPVLHYRKALFAGETQIGDWKVE